MREGLPDPIRVVIVDDHDLVAETLRRALGDESDIEIVASANSVVTAVQAARVFLPDVMVMDYRLPDGTGAEAATVLKAEQPDIEIVVLTGLSNRVTLADALEAGCSGFVSKEDRFTELIEAIRAVHAGEVRVPSALVQDLANHLRPRPLSLGDDLTPREHEVLVLLAAGKSTTDIVETLFLSIHTVRNHIRNLLSKLQVRSRLEAVVVATRLGLIAPVGNPRDEFGRSR
ncbi:MAG TPA: response regulator transcription factor [Acidimicrobiia bacterium]|jgi:DNA-binding NarL/FixJ family response regulator